MNTLNDEDVMECRELIADSWQILKHVLPGLVEGDANKLSADVIANLAKALNILRPAPMTRKGETPIYK